MNFNIQKTMKTKLQKQLSKLLAAYHKKWDCFGVLKKNVPFGKERNDTARVQRKK